MARKRKRRDKILNNIGFMLIDPSLRHKCSECDDPIDYSAEPSSKNNIRLNFDNYNVYNGERREWDEER